MGELQGNMCSTRGRDGAQFARARRSGFRSRGFGGGAHLIWRSASPRLLSASGATCTETPQCKLLQGQLERPRWIEGRRRTHPLTQPGHGAGCAPHHALMAGFTQLQLYRR